MNGLDKYKEFVLIVDSWIFYLIVFVFGFLAIYLMDIGIFKWQIVIGLGKLKMICQRTNQNAVDVVGLDPYVWIRAHIRIKMNMNKAHPSAVGLYIGTGFAHMHSIVNAYGLIWTWAQILGWHTCNKLISAQGSGVKCIPTRNKSYYFVVATGYNNYTWPL